MEEYECKECGVKFSSKEEFEKHMEEHHKHGHHHHHGHGHHEHCDH